MKKVKILDSKTGYDLVAQYYDKKEKYLDSFEQYQLLPLLGDIKDKKILDVGAGTGRIAIKLANKGAEVTAIDVSAEMLNVLKKKNSKIKTVVADAELMPFPDESFDIVVTAFVVVHFQKPEIFFREAYRVLKNGGILLLTNINQKEPPEVKTDKGFIKIESYYHRPERIIELLESELFTIEKEVIIKEGEKWVNQIVLVRK